MIGYFTLATASCNYFERNAASTSSARARARSKNLCAEKGIAAPIVHKFEPYEPGVRANFQIAPTSKARGRSIELVLGFGAAGLLVSFPTEYRGMWVLMVLLAVLYLALGKEPT